MPAAVGCVASALMYWSVLPLPLGLPALPLPRDASKQGALFEGLVDALSEDEP